jgi:hypothetical protein
MTDTARRTRRARWVVVGTALFVVIVVGTVVVVSRGASGSASGAVPPPKAATAAVQKTDLTDSDSVDGKVGFGPDHAISGRKPGTITGLPNPGDIITRGKPLYWVDAKPVPLFYGPIPFYRDLTAGMTDGPDVKELEDNLQALGFGGFGKPDQKFTAATANALKKWQKSLKLDQTGALALGDVVVESDAVRISELTGQLGAPATGSLVKVTGTQRLVTLQLDANKGSEATVGAKVTVSVNGGKPGAGEVTQVTTSSGSGGDGSGGNGSGGNGSGNGSGGQGGGDGTPKITVIVKLDDQASAGNLDGAPASVTFTTGTRQGVLVVPIGALLALADGGYGVQIVDAGGQQHLVKVTTGLFADGDVEITGQGIAEGTKVVTTS